MRTAGWDSFPSLSSRSTFRLSMSALFIHLHSVRNESRLSVAREVTSDRTEWGGRGRSSPSLRGLFTPLPHHIRRVKRPSEKAGNVGRVGTVKDVSGERPSPVRFPSCRLSCPSLLTSLIPLLTPEGSRTEGKGTEGRVEWMGDGVDMTSGGPGNRRTVGGLPFSHHFLSHPSPPRGEAAGRSPGLGGDGRGERKAERMEGEG